MKNRPFRIPSRIPQLYFGPSAEPRKMSGRQMLAELLYVFLWVLSYALFILGGLFGYLYNRFYGFLIFATLGYVSGVWMRRSLGIRGRKTASGFFTRMRERALGSRPGLLEWLLEKVSGKDFTQAKCRSVTQVYEKAVKGLKGAKSTEEQNKILAGLDKSVKQILYG